MLSTRAHSCENDHSTIKNSEILTSHHYIIDAFRSSWDGDYTEHRDRFDYGCSFLTDRSIVDEWEEGVRVHKTED